jgi:hypothetical protein
VAQVFKGCGRQHKTGEFVVIAAGAGDIGQFQKLPGSAR